MYRHCSSENDATRLVMKGWPITAASVLRSLRTCSTCFNLMTVAELATNARDPPYEIALTIGFSEDLQSINFVFILLILQSGEPYSGESA